MLQCIESDTSSAEQPFPFPEKCVDFCACYNATCISISTALRCRDIHGTTRTSRVTHRAPVHKTLYRERTNTNPETQKSISCDGDRVRAMDTPQARFIAQARQLRTRDEHWPAKQLGNPLRQQMPSARLFAQADMPAHRGYHRRKKPAASTRPTWPSAVHRLRNDCTA